MLEALTGAAHLCGSAALAYCVSIVLIVVALCIAGKERRDDLLEALRILCRARFPSEQRSGTATSQTLTGARRSPRSSWHEVAGSDSPKDPGPPSEEPA
jgi:hypothetical protein